MTDVITSRNATLTGPPAGLAVVWRLWYVPQLAEGVGMVGTLASTLVCFPSQPQPALVRWDAVCVVVPPDSGLPGQEYRDLGGGTVAYAVAASGGGSTGGSTGRDVVVAPGVAEGVWTGFVPVVHASTTTT